MMKNKIVDRSEVARWSFCGAVIRNTVFGLMLLGSGAWEASCFADETLRSKLESVFSSELAGKAVDRRDFLSSVLPEKRADDQGVVGELKLQDERVARWQSGYFIRGGAWKLAEDLEHQGDDLEATLYEKQRGTGEIGVELHRGLAKWCKAQGLVDKAKAHWFGVLDNDPSDIEARKELGFVFMLGRWVSAQELSQAKTKTKLISDDLKRWMPRVREWAAALEGSDTKKRLRAISQLKEVKDPGVIVALDIAIGQVSSETAQHFIHAIHRFETKEACLSLAGIAMANASTEVGLAAIDALKDYPFAFYVPDLLDLMCTEVELKNQLVTRSNGDLVLQLVQMRELRDKIQENQLDKILVVGQQASNQRPFNGLAVERIGQGLVQFYGFRSTKGVVYNEVASSIAEKEARRNVASANAQVQKSNEAIRKLQSDIATVLRGTTGLKLADTPKSWWDWWDQYEESYSAGEKYLDSQYAQDQSSVAYAPEQVSTVSGYPPLVPRRHECLVLGTQITTDSGLKSIEKIRVGDLVLSQDIASGEMSLKPVLRTTVRPAALTKEFVLNSGEAIRSTLGHPWWVIGRGWTKTKELQQGMTLRTTSGFSTLDSLKEAEAIETFNLVVDQTHTYFVGQSRVLAYDATELVPTFQKVPGVPSGPLR